MSGCHRFEQEGLELLESGQPLGDHFSTCPDCRRQSAAFEQLIAGLANLGATEAPPADWRQRVRREIRGRPTVTWRSRLGDLWPRGWLPVATWRPAPTLAAATLATAAVVLAFVVLVPRWSGSMDPTLRASLERGNVTFRGDGDARPGDTLLLEASGDPGQRLELRLYRNERELIARCQSFAGSETVNLDSASCSRRLGGLSLRWTLDAVGRYQPVLLLSPEALPPPAGGLDDDLDAVLGSGGKVEMGDEILVR